MMRQQCSVIGCTGLEELANGRTTGGLCGTHRRRLKLGLPFAVSVRRKLSPLQLLLKAANVAPGDEKASDRVTYAARRWVASLGPRKLPSK